MSCCGQVQPASNVQANTQMEGDVLARPRWYGNRTMIGRVTGRRYPRTSAGKGEAIWIDPRDLAADGQNWERTTEDAQPVVSGLEALANMMLGRQAPPAQYRPTRPQTLPPMEPDVAAIIRMGLEALGEGH